MYVERILLKYFRNYDTLDIQLSPTLNILCGNNAQGKTNILEAIYICSMGRSQRTQKDKETIKMDKDEAHIQIYVKDNNNEDRLDVHLKRNFKKGIAINGVAIKKLSQLLGTIYVVMFSPEDLQLIKSSPSQRRRFMDMEICQISSVYYYNLQQYYRVLKQRNNLLKSIYKKPNMKDTIFIWDSQLVSYGKKIINARENFIKKISDIALNIHSNITSNKELMLMKYNPNTTVENFEQRLNSHLQQDIIQGATSIGPHKDDIQFFVNDSDVRIYGSQGQQRTTALAVKLAEIKLIQEQKLCNPIVLLDDVLSELDEIRQKYLLENIKHIQTILTCTSIEESIKKYTDKARVYRIEQAQARIYK